MFVQLLPLLQEQRSCLFVEMEQKVSALVWQRVMIVSVTLLVAQSSLLGLVSGNGGKLQGWDKGS